MTSSENMQSLIQHLEELRKRLIICVICVFAATVMGFTLADRLHKLLLRPAGNLELIFVSPPEALMANFRLAFMAGLVMAMPLLLYQLLAFILPGLYKDETKVIIPAVLAMVVFFALGVGFAYFTVFPFAIQFFINFASETVSPMFTISNYLSFATSFLFGFGVVFQLPILFWVLGRLGVVDAAFLRRHRKYAVLVIVIASAVLTPPDVISQAMMAGPLMLLYELGILLVVLSRRTKRAAAADKV
ncbi:MAG: twin-arginine translocase subunit TatC [Bacillota bacterium]|nr:twin-arginine translocase subunit TatC [Bacillota bacterium]MDW7684037.1 twin-arginine translocase subunit TatC [Bacillota bacterium]